jgi:dethiobiotin synthetase/adenosylmethionine--8-amino-7-oxononanoate aminotransferase
MTDSCASWWTQGIGHGDVAMSLALARNSSQFGHIMFPSNLHLPASRLANFLTHDGPGRSWASRVFYSDDGSTAMEIAVKMALRLKETRAPSPSSAGEFSQ